jgi:hypothetical protein
MSARAKFPAPEIMEPDRIHRHEKDDSEVFALKPKKNL